MKYKPALIILLTVSPVVVAAAGETTDLYAGDNTPYIDLIRAQIPAEFQINL